MCIRDSRRSVARGRGFRGGHRRLAAFGDDSPIAPGTNERVYKQDASPNISRASTIRLTPTYNQSRSRRKLRFHRASPPGRGCRAIREAALSRSGTSGAANRIHFSIYRTTVRSSVLSPFHRICTPIHTRMNDDKRMITFIAESPSVRPIRSANR